MFRSAIAFLGLAISTALAVPPVLDFTGGKTAQGWLPAHDIAKLEPTASGLKLTASGTDPFLHGPTADYTSAAPLVFVATIHSEAEGWAQVFASDKVDREDRSAHVRVLKGRNELAVVLPPMGAGSRLRFDPPGDCTIGRIGVIEAGSAGITSVHATPAELKLAVKGLAGPVEIAELSPEQTATDAAGATVVWKGTAPAEFAIPRIDGMHDRSASGFIAIVAHPVLGRIPVGTVHFAETFVGIAKDARPFPNPGSKKGLQIQMVDDAIALGVRHAGINLSLGPLIDLERKPGNPTWVCEGETFAFRKSYLDSLNVKKLSDEGMAVYLIVLAYETGRPAMDSLILHPAHDPKMPNKIAAFDTVTPRGVRQWRATMEFLADWFSRENNEHGRVAGYIIGNEVNVHWQWHSLGRMPRNAMVADYLRQTRLANAAVRKSSATARCYMSLTHFWTIDPDKDHWRSMPGRYFIEEFARQARAGGDFEWHLAHHPYPEDLGNPRTWEDKTAPQSPDAPRITFKNLEQLDRFFARPELLFQNKRRSVILSEQGFHSKDHAAGDRDQAAGYCYAWAKIARLPGIDAFILHRHVDHQYEGGLNLGLWRRKPDTIATPSTPRPMYDCFKAAGTPREEEAFRFALPVIGIEKWDDVLVK